MDRMFSRGLRVTGLVLALLCVALVARGQFVDLGQDATRVKWREIRTEDFQVIYPEWYEERAQVIANIYARLYAHANTLGVRPRRMSMVVRADGGVSNGNAGWAPKKSELYGTPPQEVTGEWLRHLCVHEFRHVVQYDRVNVGFTRLLYYVFGEQATMAVVGLYLPMWLIEGDATVFETSVNEGQRGRSPEFLNETRARVVERGLDSYYKVTFGSLRDYVPGSYEMGYYLVGTAREWYGPGVWARALERVGRRSYGVAPLARSLRLTMEAERDLLWRTERFRSAFVNVDSARRVNERGGVKAVLYRDVFSVLGAEWRREVEGMGQAFDTLWMPGDGVYVNYHSPLEWDGAVVAFKEGMAETGALVRWCEGREEVLARTGVVYDEGLARRGEVVAWSEYRYHPRWEHGGRMVLASWNERTGEYRRHAGEGNRFAPFATGDGWGFVEVNRQGQVSLVLVDDSWERELARVEAGREELFVHPTWDGEGVVTVVTGPRGNRLERVDVESGEREALTGWTRYELDEPCTRGDMVYFRASFSGDDAIYRLAGGEMERVVEGRFGVRYPALSADGDSLYFCFYTADGFRVGRVATADLTGGEVEWGDFALAEELKRQEGWQQGDPGQVDSVYESRPYRRGLHLLNVHSWGPIFPDAEDVDVDFGLAVSSQNKLSTLFFTAGFVRGAGYEHGNWQAKLWYRGLWPKFAVEFKSGREDASRMEAGVVHLTTGERDTVLGEYRTRFTRGTGTVEVPFNLSQRNWLRQVTGLVQYEVQAIHDWRLRRLYEVHARGDMLVGQRVDAGEYALGKVEDVKLQVMRYCMVFANQWRTSERDLYPRWGQRLEVGYEHTPFGGLDYGADWWGEVQLYVPGLGAHHALSVYAGVQSGDGEGGGFGNQVYSPRGMTLGGDRVATGRLSYYLPVAYPDVAVGPLAYLKRLNVGAFFDVGSERWGGRDYDFYSYGAEVTADGHLLSLPFPMKFGFRVGYETMGRRLFGDFLFSVSFTL